MEKRNYKKEYNDYHGKLEQKKRRASRNTARKLLEQSGIAKKGDNKDVHHKDNNPLNNKRNNLSVTSKKYNRGKANKK